MPGLLDDARLSIKDAFILLKKKHDVGPIRRPDTPAPLEKPPAVDTSVVDRLADLYASSFGAASEGSGQVAVVPVGPQQGGGGGISLGTVAILAAVGVGGYFVYKKVRGAA